MITIDGSMGEGGGQILRTSLSLACLLQKDVRIHKIRAGRTEPGLKPQHLVGVKALAELTDAETSGVEPGSQEVAFSPRTRRSGTFKFDVGTAGSVSLILQALMPTLAFTPYPVTLELRGGTDVKWSPPVDYIRMVVLPNLSLLGYKATMSVLRRGHYPKGGGQVSFIAAPTRGLSCLQVTSGGKVETVTGVSHSVRLPAHVAQRQTSAARSFLEKSGISAVDIEVESHDPATDTHLGPGSGIALKAKMGGGSSIGGDSLGKRGKPAERVGEEAASILVEDIRTGKSFDRHMGDMIIPYLAVAEGESEVGLSRITLHSITNIKVTQMISEAEFHLSGSQGEPGILKAKGIGLS